MKAMLFAAGLGTRLKPFTLNAPKALYPINGKPLLQRNIEFLKSFGFNEFIVNVHHFADKINEFLEVNQNFGVDIQISDETENLLETGGGLMKAKHLLGPEPFLVYNADILTDMDITDFIAFHEAQKPLVSLAVSNRNSTRKLLFDKEMRLSGWKDLRNDKEIVTHSNYQYELAFSGIHIIDPKFFDLNPLEGKHSIMKSYLELMKNEVLLGYDHTGAKLLDVGRPENTEMATRLFN